MLSNLRQLKVFQNLVRCMSNVPTIRESQPSKFTVIKDKFVRVPVQASVNQTEEITHTGQYFEDGDWRRNRFQDRKKLVNRNWAVKMIAEIPPIEVEGRIAVCDGRAGPDDPAALGHPRVYINLDNGLTATCMYCGLRYVRKQR